MCANYQVFQDVGCSQDRIFRFHFSVQEVVQDNLDLLEGFNIYQNGLCLAAFIRQLKIVLVPISFLNP